VKLSNVIQGNKKSLSKIFEAITPWGEGKAVGNKIVWARCRGIPLSLWTALGRFWVTWEP